jgi:peptidoglycan/xylan/chitin deacetylase (PgdA/CDA1 family)
MGDGPVRDRARPFRPTPFLRLTIAAHVVGAGALAAAPGRWPWVAAALAANHLAITAAGLLPRCRLLGPNLTRVAAMDNAVALSFDDGPDPDVTPAVLDRLAAHGATATFFLVGARAERFADTAAAVAARGHGIGNHSHRHPHAFALYGPRAVAREVGSAQDAIERATGRRPRLFRAPVGMRGPFLEPCLAREGLSLVSWRRRGFDAVSGDAAAVAARLLRGTAPGDILLLHDGGSARDASGRPVVLEALPRLLDGLAARGLRARAIPDTKVDGAPALAG